MIPESRIPILRAAVTNSRPLQVRVAPLAMRPKIGINTIVKEMTSTITRRQIGTTSVMSTFVAKTETSANASTKFGIAKPTLNTVDKTKSTLPRTKAAVIPSALPINPPKPTAVIAINTDIRVPEITDDNKSYPLLSVPRM